MTFGEPLSWWERFNIRMQPNAKEMAELELKDAEFQALQMQGKAEYYELRKQIGILTTEYHHNRIARLKTYLGHDVAAAGPIPGIPGNDKDYPV